MFAPTRYIAWATQFYGRVPCDLASSGIPLVRWSDLEAAPVDVDDLAAPAALVRAIARYVDRPEAEVVPALGTSHAIFLAYAAMLTPGDEVLVETPGYEPLTRAAEGLGATVRTFERRAEAGFAVDPGAVAAAMTPRTRAVVVTSLHNPTGVRVPDATLRELAAIAEARGAYLVVDEVYAPFDRLPEDGVFRGSARGLAPNVIALASLTKAYGLAMYRLGWLLGPPEIALAAGSALVATLGHLPSGHAAHGVAAFAAVGRLATRARRSLEGKRARVEAWARALPGATWSGPEDGLFGMVTLAGRGDLTPRIEELARSEGVLVAAGAFFGAPSSYRLSWATASLETLDRALPVLATL